MDLLLRLAWALPLVMLVGLGAMLLMKRFAMPTSPRRTQRMQLRESLTLADETRAYLIEVDGKSFLIVESVRNAAIQQLSTASAEVPRAGSVFQMLRKASSR